MLRDQTKERTWVRYMQIICRCFTRVVGTIGRKSDVFQSFQELFALPLWCPLFPSTTPAPANNQTCSTLYLEIYGGFWIFSLVAFQWSFQDFCSGLLYICNSPHLCSSTFHLVQIKHRNFTGLCVLLPFLLALRLCETFLLFVTATIHSHSLIKFADSRENSGE